LDALVDYINFIDLITKINVKQHSVVSHLKGKVVSLSAPSVQDCAISVVGFEAEPNSLP
jgi:hypothetical protein